MEPQDPIAKKEKKQKHAKQKQQKQMEDPMPYTDPEVMAADEMTPEYQPRRAEEGAVSYNLLFVEVLYIYLFMCIYSFPYITLVRCLRATGSRQRASNRQFDGGVGETHAKLYPGDACELSKKKLKAGGAHVFLKPLSALYQW